MEVDASQVKSVYVAAARLKMERVVNNCAQYLVDHLDPATAIEIRALPGIQRNPDLAARVDAYLASEVSVSWGEKNFKRHPDRFANENMFLHSSRAGQISNLASTKALRCLPLIQVEVLASSREEMSLRDANDTLLCHLVLEWIHRNWEPTQLTVEQLTAKVFHCIDF